MTAATRAVLAVGLVFAATPGVRPNHPPSVRTIIARFVAARGGLDRLHAIHTVRMVGSITFGNGPAMRDVVELARPNRVRTQLATARGELVQAYDGCAAWMIDPARGDTLPHVLPPASARNVAAGADLDGPLVDAAAKGNRISFVGIDTADGRPAWALRVMRPDSTVEVYDIDTVSYRQTKWLGHRAINGRPLVFESYFHHYRAVGGVFFPLLIESRTRGRAGGQRIAFDSIMVNVPIAGSRFAMPGAAPVGRCAAAD